MKVMVVDDDALLREFYCTVLSPKYEVYTASSGEEAIDSVSMVAPDLILLDIDMPGINGYATCARLREVTNAPIIFATALTTMEEHLQAYDAGGDDLMVKPLVPDIVLRKVDLAIHKKHEQQKLHEEKNSVQAMAMNFLSSMGEGGILLNFMRASLVCRSFEELADKLIIALQEFGLQGSFIIRHEGINLVRTTHGEATALEHSILENSRSMGRIFQFKQNMVINYEKISIVVAGLPKADEDKIGRIRDNLAILAETAEAFCENVDMRQVAIVNAENMQVALFEASKAIDVIRARQQTLLMDVRLLLNDMTGSIEDSYSWLGTSSDQEHAISSSMNESVQQVLAILAAGGQMNEEFEKIIRILQSNSKSQDVDLF